MRPQRRLVFAPPCSDLVLNSDVKKAEPLTLFTQNSIWIPEWAKVIGRDPYDMVNYLPECTNIGRKR